MVQSVERGQVRSFVFSRACGHQAENAENLKTNLQAPVSSISQEENGDRLFIICTRSNLGISRSGTLPHLGLSYCSVRSSRIQA